MLHVARWDVARWNALECCTLQFCTLRCWRLQRMLERCKGCCNVAKDVARCKGCCTLQRMLQCCKGCCTLQRMLHVAKDVAMLHAVTPRARDRLAGGGVRAAVPRAPLSSSTPAPAPKRALQPRPAYAEPLLLTPSHGLRAGEHICFPQRAPRRAPQCGTAGSADSDGMLWCALCRMVCARCAPLRSQVAPWTRCRSLRFRWRSCRASAGGMRAASRLSRAA